MPVDFGVEHVGVEPASATPAQHTAASGAAPEFSEVIVTPVLTAGAGSNDLMCVLCGPVWCRRGMLPRFGIMCCCLLTCACAAVAGVICMVHRTSDSVAVDETGEEYSVAGMMAVPFFESQQPDIRARVLELLVKTWQSRRQAFAQDVHIACCLHQLTIGNDAFMSLEHADKLLNVWAARGKDRDGIIGLLNGYLGVPPTEAARVRMLVMVADAALESRARRTAQSQDSAGEGAGSSLSAQSLPMYVSPVPVAALPLDEFKADLFSVLCHQNLTVQTLMYNDLKSVSRHVFASMFVAMSLAQRGAFTTSCFPLVKHTLLADLGKRFPSAHRGGLRELQDGMESNREVNLLCNVNSTFARRQG